MRKPDPHPWGHSFQLLQGDPMKPCSTDILAQTAYLDVGSPVPDRWRVLTGNNTSSLIARVVLRYEVDPNDDWRKEDD